MLMRYRISARYFYPRSPCGERLIEIRFLFRLPKISIHALLAESDLAGPSGPAFLYNFYPRSPCGERPRTPTTVVTLICISIHALLAESDNLISIISQHSEPFLSTLSLRRATTSKTLQNWRKPHISIHALLAESDRAL